MSVMTPDALARRFGRRTADLRGRLLVSSNPEGPLAESFRLLAANVAALLARAARRALVVVSPNPGDGRSLVAANLAIAMSERHRVLLVEEDTRTLSGLLSADIVRRNGIPPELARSVMETSQLGVYVKPRADGAPLVSEELNATIAAASMDGMFTIIDSPPALRSSDAFLLAQRAGSVLYVVRKDAGPLDVHRQVRKHLELLDAHIIGLVLNEF
jgi:Mrp family chromosome partitioning ATPase